MVFENLMWSLKSPSKIVAFFCMNPVTEELFWGEVILTPKRSLKNSFSRVKIPPDLELILRSKNNPKKGVFMCLRFLLHFQSLTNFKKSKNNPCKE